MDLKHLFYFLNFCNWVLFIRSNILYNKYGTGFQVYLTKKTNLTCLRASTGGRAPCSM